MELSIIHRPETNRFETVVDGVTAYVEYRKEDDSIDILHTIVPVSYTHLTLPTIA